MQIRRTAMHLTLEYGLDLSVKSRPARYGVPRFGPALAEEQLDFLYGLAADLGEGEVGALNDAMRVVEKCQVLFSTNDGRHRGDVKAKPTVRQARV